MKHLVLLAASVAFLSSAIAPAHSEGVLVDAKGKVEVVLPDGKNSAGKIGLELPDGSRVKVSPDGTASIMLQSGAIDQLHGGSQYTVGADAKEVKRTNMGSRIALAMRELIADGNGPSAHAMMKEMKGPVGKIEISKDANFGIRAVAPVGTRIRLIPRIAFEWNTNPSVDWQNPVIAISDSRKKNIAVEKIGPGSRQIEIDVSKVSLKKGNSYTWYLAQSEGGSIKGKTMRFEFGVLSAVDEKAIDADVSKVSGLDMSDDGKNLLKAQLYLGMSMNLEAARILETLAKKSDSPFINKLLKVGYARMGRAD